MPPEQHQSAHTADSSATHQKSRLESSAFYIFLATVVLAPLAFWPSTYVALDAVKAVVIGLGTLVSALLYCIVSMKERSLPLPPKGIYWTSKLVALSLIISAFTGMHAMKSLFGQGFESGTVSFILTLFVAAWVAYMAMRKDAERAIVLYVGMSVSFIILFIFHAVRFASKGDFGGLSLLQNLTTTVLGNWYGLGMLSGLVSIVCVAALAFLPLSRRIKLAYWVLLVLSAIGAFFINGFVIWIAAAIIYIVMAFWLTFSRQAAGSISSWVKSIAWLPLIAGIISLIFIWHGTSLAGPTITKIGAAYSELTLPWQYTLDVTSDTIKEAPLFGIGPNHFSQAFLLHKPAGINVTDAWSAEFSYGFGYLSTFIATQGIVGALAWLLFLVSFALLGVRALKRESNDPHARFILASSFFGAAFLWIISIVYVPPQAMLFYMLALTGIAVGAAVRYGSAEAYSYGSSALGAGLRKMAPSAIALCTVIVAVWALIYVKNMVALAYFDAGAQQLTAVGNTDKADADFATAMAWNPSDVYLQARAEANLAKAANLARAAASVQNPTASSSQAAASAILQTLNNAMLFASSSVGYDPNNYYNYISEARVSELATSLQVPGGYDSAATAYVKAINLNPLNPSIYLSLARLEANQNKLDDALKALGGALQAKNNYLEAIFLLSQVEAAQGNLKDAITAAQVAAQLSPSNPAIFFELGLLQYTNKDYTDAAQALSESVRLQPDYANAQYFLGLSYVRLNRISDAIAQFQQLSKTNSENKEVAFILTNLMAGKSPFADAKPPVTPAPEKRSSLPIKPK